MIDFTLLMLDVVQQYRVSEKPVFVWIYPENKPERWIVAADRHAYPEEPTFVFGWPPEGRHGL